MFYNLLKFGGKLLGVAGAAALLAAPAYADSGFYIGGSVGGATVEANLDGDLPPVPGVPDSIDEDDTAFKVFGGYHFDLPVIDLGIEAGYVDFGQPEIDVLDEQLTIDTTAIQLWGVAGINAGPIDLFAKVGYIDWEAELAIDDLSAVEDDSDIGYGVGVGFGLGPVRVRGEYELFELDEVDVSMLSVGVEFRF